MLFNFNKNDIIIFLMMIIIVFFIWKGKSNGQIIIV